MQNVSASLSSDVAPSSYVPVAKIAEGGMGYVELCLRAEGPSPLWAARKRIHANLRGDPEFRSMFMDEARLASSIRHPNVVSVLEVGADAEGPYLVMDYVEGLPLYGIAREARRSAQEIPIQIAARICSDIALGLHAAHEMRGRDGNSVNLVHRDVSPKNILVGFDGSTRLTDFGIAKALDNMTQTTPGTLKGSLGYFSPEQLRCEDLDRRSDLFSLGVVLYELLSGTRLYRNRTGSEGTRRILTEEAPDIRSVRPVVPAPLAEVLHQMLEKNPLKRPATALEVASRLQAVLAQLASREGSLTVRRFMMLRFASARAQVRMFLAQHSSQPPRLPCAQLPMSTSTTRTHLTTIERRPPRRPRQRKLSRTVLAAAALALVFVGTWIAWSSSGTAARQPVAASTPASNADSPASPVRPAVRTANSHSVSRTRTRRAFHKSGAASDRSAIRS
jgi:serine/threonine protein kinase